jgi:multisubunit Na+/H+ antiporter MnhG subunit
MTIGKTKRVKPSVAKGIGAMLVIVAIVTAFIPAADNSGMLSCGVSLLAPILALVIGFANAEPKPEVKPVESKPQDSQ